MQIFAIILLISGFSVIGSDTNFAEPPSNHSHHSHAYRTHEEPNNTQELVKMARELFSQKSVSVKELVDEFSPLLSNNGFAIAQALSIIAYEEISTKNNLDVVSKCFVSIKAMNLLINPVYFSQINQKLDSLRFCNPHSGFIVAVESELSAFLKSMKVEQSISWKVIRADDYLQKKVTSHQAHSQAGNVLSDYENVLVTFCIQQERYLVGDDMRDNFIANRSQNVLNTEM